LILLHTNDLLYLARDSIDNNLHWWDYTVCMLPLCFECALCAFKK